MQTVVAIDHRNSDLLIDSNGITEWDRRQLWCKWRQLFVYIMYARDGCIIPPIVLLALSDVLPCNGEAVCCIPCSGIPHKGIVDRGHSDRPLTDQTPPLCNLLNMCLGPRGIGILAGLRVRKSREIRMSCALERCRGVGSWRWSLYELFTVFPEYWPAHRLVLFQIGGISPETGVQMCADNLPLSPSLPVLPLPHSVSFFLLLFWLPSLAPALEKNKKTHSRTETKATLCAHSRVWQTPN